MVTIWERGDVLGYIGRRGLVNLRHGPVEEKACEVEGESWEGGLSKCRVGLGKRGSTSRSFLRRIKICREGEYHSNPDVSEGAFQLIFT